MDSPDCAMEGMFEPLLSITNRNLLLLTETVNRFIQEVAAKHKNPIPLSARNGVHCSPRPYATSGLKVYGLGAVGFLRVLRSFYALRKLI